MFLRTHIHLKVNLSCTFFDDNKAVTKMTIKGRSPSMRRVSRTHRVAIDWLFDRINMDPRIQIKYVDTTNQLADILTKGSFTRDEWNHLIHLLNIMDLSMFSCSHFFLSNRKQSIQSAMSKEGKKHLQRKVVRQRRSQCPDQ